MRRIAVLTLLAAMLPACGASMDNEEDNASGLHFITFGPGVSGLVRSVKRPEISVCLSGVAEGDRRIWADSIQSSVLKWISPLRDLTTTPLASKVTVVRAGEPCSADVVARRGTHANTSIGSRPIVRMDTTGYFASYNVLLHEFGHAFALSDTYQNGRSGDCRPGQPQAVMCNTSFSDLQRDDVAGVVRIFKQTFPNDKPRSTPAADPAADFGKLKLALALGEEIGADSYKVAVGMAGAEQRDAVAELCLGGEAECRSSESGWRSLAKLDRRGDATVFQDDEGITAQDGLRLTVRYKNGVGAAYRTFTLAGSIP